MSISNSSKLGFFLTIEGIEGAGKSTCLSFISEWLNQHHLKHLVTREPGGTKVGESIRGLLLQNNQDPMDKTAELLLIFAARAQHINQVILPQLESGNIVVCDRFTDATYAYQGAGQNLDDEKIATLENLVQNKLRPTKTLILDIPVQTGFARVRQRGQALDRIELQDPAFFERVRNGYLERAKAHPELYHVIDASQTLEHVQHNLSQILDQWFIPAL